MRNNDKTYVVVLNPDQPGRKIYIGNLGQGNQGVFKLANANLYTEHGAVRLAGQYEGAKAEKVKVGGPNSSARYNSTLREYFRLSEGS